MPRSTVHEPIEYDEIRAAATRRKIARVVRHELAAGGVRDRRTTEAIMTQFVVVTGPELPTISLGLADVDEDGGRSIKPGNIVFNLRKLMVAVGEGAVGVAGASMPWVLVVSVLLALNSLHEAMEIEIGQTEALVLAAMWQRRDAHRTVKRASVQKFVNEALAAKKKRPLGRSEIDAALVKLQQLRCIATADGGRIRLRERVNVKYD